MTKTTMVVGGQDALGALVPDLELARTFASESKALRTREAYRYQWKNFTEWCDARTLGSLPAEPATLAAYLASRTEMNWKVASIALALTAIGSAHKTAGLASPSAHPIVAATWAGIRRTLGTAQRRAAPATVEAVRSMVLALPNIDGAPTSATLRNRALVLIGFAGAFRRSELEALNVGDLSFRAEGLVVTVRRSKTDQEGAGAEVAIALGNDPLTCPVHAVRSWLSAARIEEGPVFRTVDRHGHVGGRLVGADVARIIKRLAERARLDASRFSGHSLRAGLATSAAIQGKADRRIMAQGRWKTRTMVDRYVRDASLFRDNVSAGIGL